MSVRIDFEIRESVGPSKCPICAAPVAVAKTMGGKRKYLDLNTAETRDGKRFAELHSTRCPQSLGRRKA